MDLVSLSRALGGGGVNIYELCALSVDNPLEPFIPLLSLSIWWNVNKMNKVGKQGKRKRSSNGK